MTTTSIVKNITYWVRNERTIVVVCLSIIFCYCIPYNMLGSGASLNINDNMDSVLVWYKVIIDNGMAFASNRSPVNAFMNGITRASFPSELNFTFLWFWIFGPLGGYILERWLFALVAFCGMYVLLGKFVIPGKRLFLIQIGVALTFSLLPHWPYGGLSVPGLPFMLYAFLNLRMGNNRYYNWLIILIFPFYSSLVLSGFFFIVLIVLLIAIDFVKKRKIERGYILGVFLLGLVYIVTHYRLFLSFLIQRDFVSHRVDFTQPSYGIIGTVNFFVDRIYTGNQVVICTVILAGILMWNNKEFSSKYKFALFFIVISAVLTSFLYSRYLGTVTAFLFQILPFNLERVSWLYPLLWSILFAISLSYVLVKLRVGKYLVLLAFAAQLTYDIAHHELVVSAFSLKAGEKKGDLVLKLDPSYEHFFAKKQFAEIAQFIGLAKNQYRVFSLGMHPSISQFNGFYTVDGYSANYDRKYKLAFRKVIKGELDKNVSLKDYFDTWGSRVYLFTAADIGYVNVSGNSILLRNLDFDTKAMKELGGKYIFSAVRIDTGADPEYKFLKKFQNPDSAWDIYLYEII